MTERLDILNDFIYCEKSLWEQLLKTFFYPILQVLLFDTQCVTISVLHCKYLLLSMAIDRAALRKIDLPLEKSPAVVQLKKTTYFYHTSFNRTLFINFHNKVS